MNCYLVVWPPENGDPTVLTEAFPEHHAVLEGTVYMVAAEQRTCAEVCEVLGFGNGAKGNGADRSGVVIKVDNYYGLFDRALWEKMNAWQAM